MCINKYIYTCVDTYYVCTCDAFQPCGFSGTLLRISYIVLHATCPRNLAHLYLITAIFSIE
jgi:hypothetical protein